MTLAGTPGAAAGPASDTLSGLCGLHVAELHAGYAEFVGSSSPPAGQSIAAKSRFTAAARGTDGPEAEITPHRKPARSRSAGPDRAPTPPSIRRTG